MRFFVHPLFILTAIVTIFFAVTEFFIALTIAVFLHEIAHAMIAKNFGVAAVRVTLAPFGGVLNLKTKVLTPHQKSIIYLAGPIASLFFSLFFGVMVWLFPVIFNYLEYLVVANFLVGVINLFPIYPLDGGKVLAQVMSARLIFIWSNVIFVGVLLFALITFRWWWIFFSIIMLLQINWEFKQNLYLDKFNLNKNKFGKFVKCAVMSSMSLCDVYRLVNHKQPTEFVVIDCHNRVFYENDLEQWLLKNDSYTLLEKCL